MIIDCDSCDVRGVSCGDCVIGVLLGSPSAARPSGLPMVQLDPPVRRALDVLADQGLVPRLQLVETPRGRTTRGLDDAAEIRHAG